MNITDAIILAAVLAIGTFVGRVLFWAFVVLVIYVGGCVAAYDSSDTATELPTYLYAASPQEVTHES